MSVIVGFSQATAPLVTGSASTGIAAPALGIEATGEADLFAALVAMLAPGATPPPPPAQPEAPKTGSAILNVEPTSAPLPNAPAPTPPADVAATSPQAGGPVPTPAPETAAPAVPAATPTTELGKTLLKEFGAALRAAQATLQDGKPLDPEIEHNLRETLDAVVAYLSGLPQPQTPVAPPAPSADAAAMVKELAAGLLPTPATTLPPAPPVPGDGGETADLPEGQQPIAAAPVTTPEAATPVPAAVSADAPAAAPDIAARTAPVVPTGTPSAAPSPAPATMQAKIVPEALAKLGTALKDLAAQLERRSPELAKTLAKLGDRIAVGDIPDDVLAELGLTRAADSTSPELEQLTAALTATPKPDKPAAAAAPQQQPFAAVALDVLEPLAEDTEEPKPAKPQPVQAEPPKPEPVKPAPPKAEANPPAPIPAAAPTTPDTALEFDASTDLPADSPAPDLKPSAPNAAAAVSKPADTAPAQQSQPAPQPATPPAAVAAATPAPATQPVDGAAPVARAAHAAYQAPIQQVNLPQVAFEVARQFEAGNSRFQIRLDPPELGRIDVKLDVDKSGTVSARMTVERPETLDMMQRDQRALHQALQQAGLDANKTNLEFSLRQNPFAQQGGLADGQGGNQPRFGGAGGGDPSGTEPAPATNLYRGTASAGGVNLFV